MRRVHYKLLARAAKLRGQGECLELSGGEAEIASHLVARELASGTAGLGRRLEPHAILYGVTPEGADALDEWNARWVRRAAMVFQAFLSALFIFLFAVLADFMKTRKERHECAAERERQETEALPHAQEAPSVPAAALGDGLAEAPALVPVSEAVPEAGEGSENEPEHAEKQRPQ